MENAVDALKMAAAILVFIIAISTSFSLFSTAKQTSDTIISMRDKQKYLEAADFEGYLYTSDEKIKNGKNSNFTEEGYRIVNKSDVFSTIYRYNKEKYGVTIVDYNTHDVIARFDSNTESNIEKAGYIDSVKKVEKTLENNIKVKIDGNELKPTIDLNTLYRIINSNTVYCGAPWYGNDNEIKKRIISDIWGTTYVYTNKEYKGKDLNTRLNNKEIIEVTNEIDVSKYLEDGETKTDLLQQYEIPTVEVIYILK